MGWFGRLFGGDPTLRLRDEARSLVADGRLDEAIQRYDLYLESHAEDVQAYIELSRALVADGREDEAAEFVLAIEPSAPAVLLAQGEVLAAIDQPAKALDILRRAREWYQLEISRNLSGQADYARHGYAEASALFDAVYAELRGHEEVAVEHARRGRLNARAGVNYRLLGDSLMVGSTHSPESLFLESLDEMRAREAALGAGDREGVRGHLLLGSIALREGLADDAVEAFEKAAELDGTHFAAFRGLGAAMDMQAQDTPRAATLLQAPPASSWTGLDTVVPDVAKFTSIERTIVICSIAPLRNALPHLAQAGVAIRVMPLDARTTDHPEFAEARGERFRDDHRALEALSGVASRALALVRLDELLDVVSEHAWTFGHEFAHIALRCLEPGIRAEIAAMHAEARKSGYLVGTYAQKNEHEFFAVLYERYLARRWFPDAPRRTDEAPLTERANALFDRLEAVPAAFGSLDASGAPRRDGPYRESASVATSTQCPLCRWRPTASDRWDCTCGHRWNTFSTRGLCPSCDHQWTQTACPSCRQFSPHADWYDAPGDG